MSAVKTYERKPARGVGTRTSNVLVTPSPGAITASRAIRSGLVVHPAGPLSAMLVPVMGSREELVTVTDNVWIESWSSRSSRDTCAEI